MHARKMADKGQTVIETALLLIFLFILFFGIAEVSRAWYLKNALNNAARVGARVAVVTPSITANPALKATDCNPATPDGKVACAIWAASGVPPDATASLTFPGTLESGTAVTVQVTATFHSVVPVLAGSSNGFIPDAKDMSATITMRYE